MESAAIMQTCKWHIMHKMCSFYFCILLAAVWSLCFPTGSQIYSPFHSYIFSFILFPFVFIPLLTPLERSPVLVFEFSMAKLFIWPCHLSVQCVLLGQPHEALVMIPGVKVQNGYSFKLYLSHNPEFCLHICVCEPCTFCISGYQRLQCCWEWWMTARCRGPCGNHLR